MKILPFSKRQYKSLMLQLFVQLLSIVLFMVAFLLIINSRFIETLFYLRAWSQFSHVTYMIDEIEVQDNSFFDEMKKIETDDTVYVEIFQSSTDKLIYSTIMNDIREHAFFDPKQDLQLFLGLTNGKNISFQETLERNENGVLSRVKEVPNDIDYLMYTSVLDDGNTVRIYMQENIIKSNAEYTSGIIKAVICIVGIGLMVAFFIYAWLFTRPLIEMNDVTKHMARMDFTKKCVTKSTNELGQLAENINSMSDSLAHALGDLKDKNRQLEIDIEHEHKMEKSRKEFISNVSHELKTPIAIIQGYAEGLKLGVSDNPEDNEEYLDVIIEESKKMNNIVLDLLELSYYESGSYKLDENDFSFNMTIDEYITVQKIRIDEKDIKVELLLPDNMYVQGDEAKINMVLNNYFTNAISHCENEKIIRITAEEYDDFYRIIIFNTGKTIPEENMEELWNNFFRGDKAHRRDEGRFGLGLSIVAAIQDMHGMKYGCENRNDGVEFWFDVKKCVKDLSI